MTVFEFLTGIDPHKVSLAEAFSWLGGALGVTTVILLLILAALTISVWFRRR